MSDEVKIYMTFVTSSSKIKGEQNRIFMILDSKKIPYTKVDISADEVLKNEMREKCGDATALPPRFFHGDEYLGDFTDFDNAVEEERIQEFLKVSA